MFYYLNVFSDAGRWRHRTCHFDNCATTRGLVTDARVELPGVIKNQARHPGKLDKHSMYRKTALRAHGRNVGDERDHGPDFHARQIYTILSVAQLAGIAILGQDAEKHLPWTDPSRHRQLHDIEILPRRATWRICAHGTRSNIMTIGNRPMGRFKLRIIIPCMKLFCQRQIRQARLFLALRKNAGSA